MNAEKKKDKTQITITYHGKKTYTLNPAIAWVKESNDQVELFCFEDIHDKNRVD